MIVDKKVINKVAEYYNINLDKEFIDYIYQIYGCEPFPYERDEQGLYQGVSNLVEKYKYGDFSFRLKSKEELMQEQINNLKSIVIENMNELSKLRETMFERTQLLDDHGIEYPNNEIDF